jgi:hypothetical protein
MYKKWAGEFLPAFRFGVCNFSTDNRRENSDNSIKRPIKTG